MPAKSKAKDKSPFQQQCLEVLKDINEYRKGCEANVVSIMWKNPQLITECTLTLDDFLNNIWKVYWSILKEIVVDEGKTAIDDVVVGLHLEKHPALKEKYEEYGGYNLISDAGQYVLEENFDAYVIELRKWQALMECAKKGWIDKARLSEYVDMTAEEIYEEFEVNINNIFLNTTTKFKSYDISDGIDELIDELDEGFAVGLPYMDLPMLSKETGGQYLGAITLVGGLSNVGKSSLSRNATIGSFIKHKEPCVIMLNEEGIKKWQRETLVWVANNILKEDIQKHVVRDGKFSTDTKRILHEAADWIKEKTQNHILTIIPFEKYSTANVIKVIRKYSSMGVKYFVLDTFKLDAGKVNDNAWLEMQQHMVEINDVVKQEANNVHILVTFQLNKGSARQRFYTQDNIGMAKNIIDPASTCIMIRSMFDDEYPGCRNELHVYEIVGKNGKSRKQVKIDPNKRYQILFIVKNREGAANQYQIVIEHDLSRNILKEVGICNVPMD